MTINILLDELVLVSLSYHNIDWGGFRREIKFTFLGSIPSRSFVEVEHENNGICVKMYNIDVTIIEARNVTYSKTLNHNLINPFVKMKLLDQSEVKEVKVDLRKRMNSGWNISEAVFLT